MAGSGVAEPLTPALSGHTRQGLDLAASGSSTDRARVTVLSALSRRRYRASRPRADPQPRVCGHLPSRVAALDVSSKTWQAHCVPSESRCWSSRHGDRFVITLKPHPSYHIGRSVKHTARRCSMRSGVEELQRLNELRQSGKIHWSEN